VTPDTPEHRDIPLTLAFTPDNIKDDDPEYPYSATAIVQPSMEQEGRIFVGVNPFGKPVGVHMLPEEARKIRDHLSLLLLEPPGETEGSPEEDAAVESVESRIARAKARAAAGPTPEEILAAAQSAPAARWPRFPSLLFRFEYRWGKFQGIISRLDG
jgi:hypothetical protein